MNVASSTIIVAGGIREVFEEHRATIEEELRKLPLISFEARCGETVVIEVEYDGDNQQLEDDLITLVSDALENGVPAEVREQFQSPSFDDSVLGTFYWDDNLGRWEGELDLPGCKQSCPLNLATDDRESAVDGLVERGRAIAANFMEHDRRWKDIAVGELFEIFNSNWNDGEPLTESAFREVLRFTDLTLYENGDTHAMYFAGDLFLEHDIQVRVDAAGKTDAHLVG